MDIIIREATTADVEAIARIHVDSWRAAYRDIIPPEIIEGRTLEQRIRQWQGIIDAAGSNGSWVQVALVAGEVIGFVSSKSSGDPDSDGAGEVSAIYVAPRHWRGGAGTALLHSALGALRGAGFREATLWVVEDNVRARAFYERQGWAPDGTGQALGNTTIVEVRYRTSLID